MTNALYPEDVFIAGGLPSETYVARDELGFEASLKRWKRGRQRPLLSISGPTKTGKTVLLKSNFPNALFLSGGAIADAEEFWEAVAEQLEIFTGRELHSERNVSGGSENEGSIDAKLVGARRRGSSSSGHRSGATLSRNANPKHAARKELKGFPEPIVIDDFHYIPADQQVLIVRALKDLVFDGLAVIVAAVPHRAYDILRVEKEMTGRVQTLDISSWSRADLLSIAEQGFSSLGAEMASSDIAERLVAESFASPHLMQSHCLALCQLNETASGELKRVIESPPEWGTFFQDQASRTSKTAFDILKRGGNQKGRLVRVLSDGTKTDIYGAVLAGLEEVGAKSEIPYEVLREAIKKVLPQTLQRNEITNILNRMTKIAREDIEGEPVIEYDEELEIIFIADPFFAYYLRWAPPSLKAIDVA